MPWSVSYSPNLEAVTTVYAGLLPAAALQDAVRATIALGLENGASRFFADCEALEGGHSLADLYSLAEVLEVSGLPHGIREAVLLPQLKAAAEEVRFWETLCANRGYTVRVFRGRPEAEAWLRKDGEAGGA